MLPLVTGFLNLRCHTIDWLCLHGVNYVSSIQLISTDRLTHCGVYTPRLLRSDLLRMLELVSRHNFLLDRLPAVIHSKRSYPAVLLAEQLADQRFTIPGPLVQRNDSLNSLPLLVYFASKVKKCDTIYNIQ